MIERKGFEEADSGLVGRNDGRGMIKDAYEGGSEVSEYEEYKELLSSVSKRISDLRW